jgi:thymidine phosphorylase
VTDPAALKPAAGDASFFDAVEIVRRTRDGLELAGAELDWLVAAYTDGRVAEEQMAAWLMAVYFRGLSRAELARLTAAMVASGERLELSGLSRPTVDKHSTGGVGDKVSLVLAPLVASCGAAVPQLSGRGLGHTGGTLDKLEAIPGWRSNLTAGEIVDQLERVGCVICAAGPTLAPADRKLYALRDVTATVESIPLIAASIISKKVAEGTGSLVLDVKVGSGAFMRERERAEELARTMVSLGLDNGVRTVALLSPMDVPLGRRVGNALEVAEAVEVLSGGGPLDLVEVTLALAQEMLALAGIDADPSAALRDGSALATWRRLVHAQGGDPDAPLPRASYVETVAAPRSGVVERLDARAVGTCAWRLGAGRARKEDPVSAVAGVVCLAKPGEEVRAGEPLLELHAEDPSRLARARGALEGAVVVGDEPPPPTPAILGRIAGDR